MPDERQTGFPTVQLLHELPDGSSHVDWMLARDAAGEGPLDTFRLPARVDELGPGRTLPAERIGDHRPAYLAYEGPVSGGRGTVKRLRAGRIVQWDESPGEWELQILWAGRTPPQRLRLKVRAEPEWTVCVL